MRYRDKHEHKQKLARYLSLEVASCWYSRHSIAHPSPPPIKGGGGGTSKAAGHRHNPQAPVCGVAGRVEESPHVRRRVGIRGEFVVYLEVI